MRTLQWQFSFVLGPLLLTMCLCQLYEPVTPPRLGAPVLRSPSLCEARFYGAYREAVRLTWTAPSTDSIGIRTFTLLRKTQSDTGFDVFTRAQGIPTSIDTFYDDLTPIGFPSDNYFLVKYRIFATDSLGRSSDTAEACSLYLAHQPVLDTVDQSKSCFRWYSRRIMGSVSTFIKIWGSDSTPLWTSLPQEDFGDENNPTYFTACLPESLKPLPKGRSYYAIHLFAMGIERQSLKVDSFYVQ